MWLDYLAVVALLMPALLAVGVLFAVDVFEVVLVPTLGTFDLAGRCVDVVVWLWSAGGGGAGDAFFAPTGVTFIRREDLLGVLCWLGGFLT